MSSEIRKTHLRALIQEWRVQALAACEKAHETSITSSHAALKEHSSTLKSCADQLEYIVNGGNK